MSVLSSIILLLTLDMIEVNVQPSPLHSSPVPQFGQIGEWRRNAASESLVGSDG